MYRISSYPRDLRTALGTGLERIDAEARPTALAVVDLALQMESSVAAHEVEPIYLRDRVTG